AFVGEVSLVVELVSEWHVLLRRRLLGSAASLPVGGGRGGLFGRSVLNAVVGGVLDPLRQAIPLMIDERLLASLWTRRLLVAAPGAELEVRARFLDRGRGRFQIIHT